MVIGVGCTGWVIFVERKILRVTIDGGAAAEHESSGVCGTHGLKQADGARDVILIVVDRLLYRLAHCLQARKVDHCIDAVIVERLFKRGRVAHIAFNKRQTLPGNRLQSTERLLLERLSKSTTSKLASASTTAVCEPM